MAKQFRKKQVKREKWRKLMKTIVRISENGGGVCVSFPHPSKCSTWMSLQMVFKRYDLMMSSFHLLPIAEAVLAALVSICSIFHLPSVAMDMDWYGWWHTQGSGFAKLQNLLKAIVNISTPFVLWALFSSAILLEIWLLRLGLHLICKVVNQPHASSAAVI